MELDTAVLALIERTPLLSGGHDNFAAGCCAMELVSYIAGEPWSDRPECVCPVLGAFIRAWNDGLPDHERDALLKPILPGLIGTRGSDALAERRSLMAADWLVRVRTPALLRAVKLDAQADALASLPEITSMAQAASIRELIETGRRATAALDAAEYATTAAVAAMNTVAAMDTARVRVAAMVKVAGLAGSAAGVATWDASEETRVSLQKSAGDLVNRMIELRDAA